MNLGSQSLHSIQLDRKENDVVKARATTIAPYIEESRVPGSKPAVAVAGNWPVTRTGNSNRANSPSQIAFIRRLSLFDDVPCENSNTIISGATKKLLSRNQTIFSVGDPVEHVVLLLSGCAKITQQGQRGNKAILRLIGFGEFVGTFGWSSDCKYGSTAQVVQPGTALVWDATTFDHLLEFCVAFRSNTLRALEGCLQKMEERFRNVSAGNVGSRLSSELIRSSRYFARSASGRPEVRLSHTELGQLTGATLWSVNRQLNRWQDCGIVSVAREAVQILDLAALEKFAKEHGEPSRASIL